MTAFVVPAITANANANANANATPSLALAHRLRAHLQTLAQQRLAISYRDLAKALRLLPPHTLHQLTEALEQLMAEDAAADRPFIAALVISHWRDGLPAPGFFDCAAQLGRFSGDAKGPAARAFYTDQFNAALACWADAPASVASR